MSSTVLVPKEAVIFDISWVGRRQGRKCSGVMAQGNTTWKPNCLMLYKQNHKTSELSVIFYLNFHVIGIIVS